MMAIPVRTRSALPFSYIEGLFKTLKSCPKIQFRSYQDLPFSFESVIINEEELKAIYKEEYLKWREGKKTDPTLDIIILHDSDSGPDETTYICDYEAQLGIKSTTSIFARIMGRKGVEPYKIDFKRLAELQKADICFTYHCNAWETTGYNEAMIAERCNSDIDVLSNHGLDIRFFSPHGGVPSPDGRNNNSFFYPTMFQRPIIWTHNRFAPSGKRYSDGGFIPRLEKGAVGTDLRSYLMECCSVPNRVFILLHPQYYFAEKRSEAAGINGATPWVSEYWDLHEQGRAQAYWDPLAERLRALI